VTFGATAVDPELTSVEQHAVVEVALVDVGTDLTLVSPEILGRALGVEHKAMRDEIDRREIRLQAAAAKLGKVGVARKPEHALDQRLQNRLGEELLILPRSRAVQILAEMPRPVELAVASSLLVEQRRESLKPRLGGRGGHQKPATSAVTATRASEASEARATVRHMDTLTVEDLTPEELEALRAAGAWYAKYHAVRIAELADDPSAYAEHKREKFLTLVTALRKLGFEMALPDELRPDERQAA